ncbi:uncharacterized protein B0P05DRAFT_538092 [Gilbertella persicaria]|uniref:uncharacterized protein n=1 Tax=Gilbertella persicaria TaxID=101096 RepID=UPI002220B43B|nr:uncharacterized protein B0P05DRAFT_538092 [Gilbertella persicaria]KAI8081797.1 hypothetical protein B0P05DRAFT_538092 [Gilbertella persicaria]
MSNSQERQDVDTMTHPSLYRDSVNCKVGQKIDSDIKCQEQKQATNQADWDLYPQMIRKVENEGSPKDVEHLHQLEHTQ